MFEGRRKAWNPLSEETVLEALDLILDRTNYPVYIITCYLGRDRTGAVIGCLRKIQEWHLSSIFVCLVCDLLPFDHLHSFYVFFWYYVVPMLLFHM